MRVRVIAPLENIRYQKFQLLTKNVRNEVFNLTKNYSVLKVDNLKQSLENDEVKEVDEKFGK